LSPSRLARLACLSVLASSGTLSASDERELDLSVRGCAHLHREELQSLLQLELNTLSKGRDVPPLAVTVLCEKERLTVAARVAGKDPRLRVFKRTDALDHRQIALSASELAESIWNEPEEAAPADSQPSAPTPAEVPDMRRAFRFSLGASRTAYQKPRRSSHAGTAALGWQPSKSWEFGALLSFSASSHDLEKARIVQRTAEIAPRAHFVVPMGKHALLLGGGGRVGALWWTPRARDEGAKERSLRAPYATLFGEALFRMSFGEALFGALRGTAGAVVLPVTGTSIEDELIRLDGFTWSGGAEMGCSF